MPLHFSEPLKDLIRRIFQIDPMKRIRSDDLKYHPWISNNHISSVDSINFYENYINEEIFKKLYELPLDFQGLSKLDVRNAILTKQEYEFVIVYQILNDQQQKNKELTSLKLILINYSLIS